MSTEIKFVQVPSELVGILGKPSEGTRIYRKDGSEEECSLWFDVLTDLVGPSVSPGGVQIYCPVSRAAVHKRIKEGRLSAFCFHPTHIKTTFFGTKRKLRESPYIYIPVCEVKEWRKELEERAKAQNLITQEELEGARPDWEGRFFEWKRKHSSRKGLRI